MSGSPLDRIPVYDRVSLRVVIVPDGVDPGPALARAGITNPMALSIVFGENSPGRSFGDGFTSNLMVVLERDGPDGSGPSAPEGSARRSALDRRDADGRATSGAPDSVADRSPAEAATVNLPPAYGLQHLAPVRRFVRIGRRAGATPPSPGGFVLSGSPARAET